jgi:hypothetical protein
MLRLFLAALLAIPSSALADPLPFSATFEIGHPVRAVEIRVESGASGVTVTASIGGVRSSRALPIAADDANVELVEIARGHRAAIVRASAGDARAAAVVALAGTRPEVVWAGRLDLHGDPGERTADVLSLEDRTGDGLADIVVGARSEAVQLCGIPDAVLYARALDPARGTLRPVVLRRLPQNGAEMAVTATRQSPGPTGPPLLSTLRFSGASSTAGIGEEAAGLAAPRALTDQNPETFWAEGRGGPGTGEYVVARFEARVPIRAIAITATRGPAGARLGRPRTFWLVGDEGPRLRVTMPEDPLPHAGERYWIVPSEPLRWRCVALVLDEAYAPAGSRDAVHTGLAELEVYTELDFSGGIDALVAILVEGRENGDEATRLLTGLGAPAVSALAAAWERLDAQGRRRAVRVFGDQARQANAEAIDALARAARDDDVSVRDAALQSLGAQRAARAGEHLGALASESGALGRAAVAPLLRHEPSIAVPAILAALAGDGGSERPELRDGLALSLSRGTDAERSAFGAWAQGASVSPLASALLGLAGRPLTRPLVGPLLAPLARRTERFEDRWRAVRAAREVESEAGADAWLAEIARGAEEWMLRAAAVEALSRRDSSERLTVARAALSDAYPRVRLEAVRVLDANDQDDGALVEIARGDGWPMVREAAVQGLWDRPSGRDAVRAAIRDRSERVRRAAILAVTRAGDRQVWPLVRGRLEDDDEWPQVTVAALDFVRELCVRDAGPSVITVVRRGLRDGAWPPDIDVGAVAVELAVSLGGETEREVALLLDDPSVPASMREALGRRGRPLTGCR